MYWHFLALRLVFGLRFSALTIFSVAFFVASSDLAVAGKQRLNKNGGSTVAYYLEFRARAVLSATRT
jgi:hypothetical protein